ncbi:MAG TPA: 50S ribosomal protein L19 [Candidatus Omnitrophica bacterium]|nr:50S ribosomal protein L19 [Candidatus Omnitrophota bacterium]
MVVNIGEIIKQTEQKYVRQDVSEFQVGDTVKMKIKVKEADKERLHPFEGTVIRKTGKGLKGSFTVRKVAFGEGVERVFPLHSPVIESLKVISKGIATRSKLYFLRERIGKGVRVKQQKTQ